MTRSGKSYYAAGRAGTHAGPVLVIDPQDSECWPFGRAHPENTVAEVLDAAAAGGVVFVPSWDDRLGRAEVALLVAEVLARSGRRPGRPWLVVADEAQEYGREGGPPGGLHLLARRGLRHRVAGVFVSQRPADVAKSILAQCATHVIFEPGNFGRPYFEKYGIDADEAGRLLALGRRRFRLRAHSGAGPWPFVKWDTGGLSGPFHL